MIRGVQAFCLALALLCGCAKTGPETPPAVPVTVLPAAAVDQGGRGGGGRYYAVLAPREQVTLSFKVQGYVDELLAAAGPDGAARPLQKGDAVKAGAVLAGLRLQDFTAKVDQAKYALEEAKATLARAKRDLERSTTLLKGDYIARGDFDGNKERLDVAAARVEQAEAKLVQAGIDLREAHLRAPLSGVVVRRDVERGTLAVPGAAAFVLADLSSVKAVFGLPDQELARVKPGAKVEVAVDALAGQRFSGVVTAVSPSADAKSRVFDAEVTVANPDQVLKDGMIAGVALPGRADGRRLAAVPLLALSQPEGDPAGYQVFVLTEQGGRTVAKSRPVRLDGVVGNMATLSEGLTPGEKVIARGATLVADGQAVRVIP